MCSGILCVHKKTDSLERNDYQCPQCKSLCQVHNTPFEQPTISFSLNCDQGICIFEETQTSIQNLLEMCFVQDAQTKSVFICQLTKILVSTTVKIAKPALMRWIFLLGTKNQHSCGSVVMIHIALQEKRVVTTKKKNHLQFWRHFSDNHNRAHLNLCHKRKNCIPWWHRRVDSPLIDTVNWKFFYIFFSFTFSVEWINMIFSVSNDRIERPWDFGPDAVTLTVKDLVQDNTINSHRILPAASSLLLSQKHDFSDKPSSASSIYSQPGRDYGDERGSALLCRSTKMYLSWYQVSDLNDFEF